MERSLEKRPEHAMLEPEQYAESLAYVGHDVGRSLGCKHDPPSLPVEILNVVRKDDAGDRSAGGQRDLERVTLHLTGDRTGDREAGLRIVGARGQDQCRPSSALLMPGVRIEGQPDEIAGVRNVRAGYHTSWPTRVPQSLSS